MSGYWEEGTVSFPSRKQIVLKYGRVRASKERPGDRRTCNPLSSQGDISAYNIKYVHSPVFVYCDWGSEVTDHLWYLEARTRC